MCLCERRPAPFSCIHFLIAKSACSQRENACYVFQTGIKTIAATKRKKRRKGQKRSLQEVGFEPTPSGEDCDLNAAP